MADDLTPGEDSFEALGLTPDDVRGYIRGYEENVAEINENKRRQRRRSRASLAAFLFLVIVTAWSFKLEHDHNEAQQADLDRANQKLTLVVAASQKQIDSNCLAIRKVHEVSADLLLNRSAPLDPNAITDPLVREAVRPFLESRNAANQAQLDRDLKLLDEKLVCK